MPRLAGTRVVMGVIKELGIWWCGTRKMISCSVMTRWCVKKKVGHVDRRVPNAFT